MNTDANKLNTDHEHAGKIGERDIALDSQTILQTILDHLPSAVTLFGPDMGMIACNQKLKTLLDFPEELFTNGLPSLTDLIHFNAARGEYGPGDPKEIAAAAIERTKTRQPHVFERRRPNGKVLEVRGTPLPNGGFLTIYTDATDRKRTEEALLESEHTYRTIMEQMYDPYIEIDMAGNITFVNESICHHLGYTREELVGKNFSLIIPADEKRITFLAYKSVLESGEPNKGYAHRAVKKDGSIVFAEASINIRRNGQGEIIGFRTISRDITERKRMEAEILALSITDQLTGLHNRRGFLSLAGQQLKSSNRNKSGALLFFADLDGLKWINDTLGHEDGDKALIEAATVLKETFRTSDIIARLGGDEYAALSADITEVNSEIFTIRLQHLIDKLNSQENRRYRLSISIGCTYYDPENPCSLDELMARADKLMYAQKQNKKSLLLKGASLSNGYH